jgi:hypothetical protein
MGLTFRLCVYILNVQMVFVLFMLIIYVNQRGCGGRGGGGLDIEVFLFTKFRITSIVPSSAEEGEVNANSR